MHYSSACVQLTLTLSDRAETGEDRAGSLTPVILLSIIYHHLFICLCVFTSLVSIHLRPASHPPSQLLTCTLLHACTVLLSVTPHLRSSVCACVYISMLSESLCFVFVSQELSIKMNCLCVCLSFSLCVSEPRDLVQV